MSKTEEKVLPKLPETLFIRYNDPELPVGDDDQFLMTYSDIEEASEKGVKHLVGVYKLQEVREVELQVTEHLVNVPVKIK